MGANEDQDGRSDSVDTSAAESHSNHGGLGQFTRMFQRPATQSSIDNPDDGKSTNSTSIFSDIIPALQYEERAVPDSNKQAEPTSSKSISPLSGSLEGEFTRFFEPAVPATTPPRISIPEPIEETEKWLRSLELDSPPAADHSAEALSPASPSMFVVEDTAAGPSEFTMITGGSERLSAETPVSAPVASAPPVTPPIAAVPLPAYAVPAVPMQPVPAPTPPPIAHAESNSAAHESAARQNRAKPSYWPLIVVFNVLFLLAVLLVVYFALRR